MDTRETKTGLGTSIASFVRNAMDTINRETNTVLGTSIASFVRNAMDTRIASFVRNGMHTGETNTVLGTSIASFVAGALTAHWFASRRRRCGLLLTKPSVLTVGGNDFSSFSYVHLLLYNEHEYNASTRDKETPHQSHSPQPQTCCLGHSNLLQYFQCACFRGGADSKTIGAPVWCFSNPHRPSSAGQSTTENAAEDAVLFVLYHIIPTGIGHWTAAVRKPIV